MTMLGELENYYNQNGILATNFTCKHKNECSKDCGEFTGPKSAFVSVGYENGTLPRLLFLSLDSGSGNKIDENRLPLAVREREESRDVAALPKHKHWYRTHELAWYLLKRFDPSLRIENVHDYFAHANSAKCCMNKAQKEKADKILFENCREYLKPELEILAPEIVVTQGNEAKKAILALGAHIRGIDDFASIIKLNGKKVFWLHTYHPNNWGAFNKHRNANKVTGVAEGWEFYAEQVFTFVNEKNT